MSLKLSQPGVHSAGQRARDVLAHSRDTVLVIGHLMSSYEGQTHIAQCLQIALGIHFSEGFLKNIGESEGKEIE